MVDGLAELVESGVVWAVDELVECGVVDRGVVDFVLVVCTVEELVCSGVV